jgi:hypothetical protein
MSSRQSVPPIHYMPSAFNTHAPYMHSAGAQFIYVLRRWQSPGRTSTATAPPPMVCSTSAAIAIKRCELASPSSATWTSASSSYLDKRFLQMHNTHAHLAPDRMCSVDSLRCASRLMTPHQGVYAVKAIVPTAQAIGSRAAGSGRQQAAKRRASAGHVDATRKPKSRRLSDFSDVATSPSRWV